MSNNIPVISYNVTFLVLLCVMRLVVTYFVNVTFTVCGYGAVLQIGRSLVRLQMVSLEFFIDIILPIALWPWG